MPEDLVEALKGREPAVFERLIAQHGTMLYRVALRFTGQRHDAEEVLQQVLLQVYEKIDIFDERTALTSWRYRIVVSTALRHLRAQSRMPEELLHTSGPPFTADGQHADVGSSEGGRLWRECIAFSFLLICICQRSHF